MKIRLLVLCVAVAALAGCIPQPTTTASIPGGTYEKYNSETVSGDIDTVWDAAIQSIGESFFAITNVDKASRILTLDFSASDPSRYIDCGKVSVTTQGETTTSDAAKPKVIFYRKAVDRGGFDNATYPVTRTVSLTGKANIIFIPEGKGSVRITVNTRYVMSSSERGVEPVAVMIRPSGFKHFINDDIDSFGSGESGNLCTSRFTLERSIIDGIKARLTN